MRYASRILFYFSIMRTFNSFVWAAKNEVLQAISSEPVADRNLKPKVISSINWREVHGVFIHDTKPVHVLAYILAYKQLEEEHKIRIMRPADVPFPMTDYNTTFALLSEEVETVA